MKRVKPPAHFTGGKDGGSTATHLPLVVSAAEAALVPCAGNRVNLVDEHDAR